MPTAQQTLIIGFMPALLLGIPFVNSLREKNSLCCAAAGIVAYLRASAESLAHQEKLLEATKSDEELSDESHPSAQPVMGYNQQKLTRKRNPKGNTERSGKQLQ